MEVHLNPPYLLWNIRERKCRIDGLVVPELTHLIMDMPLIARDHHRDFSLLFRTTMTLVWQP